MNVTHIISGLTDGGAEAILYRLCTNDNANCHTVISLSDRGKYINLFRDKGFVVHCLNMDQEKILGIFKLYALVRASKADVVQTWLYHADFIGGLVSRLAGVKSVFWGIHSTTLDSSLAPRGTLRLRKVNAFLSYFIPKKIICVANMAREVHEDLGYRGSKFVVVYNGYDLSEFCINPALSAGIRKELALEEDFFHVGLVARFDPQKDHQNLLRSLAILKSTCPMIRCLLVGPNMDEANSVLTHWIVSMGLQNNVTLVGQRDDIPAFMNAIDLHVMSSACEAFPNVLNEAMACGVPCVTTDVGDASIIVDDTGWVVPAKNPEALAKAISAAFFEKRDYPTRWAARRIMARERVASYFNVKAMVSGYHRVWNN